MSDADQALTLTILKDIRVDIKEARADTRKLQDLLLASIEADRRRFNAIDRRFDVIDRRFDAIDRRFEATDGLIKITAADLEIMQKVNCWAD